MKKHTSPQGTLKSAEVVADEHGRFYHTATAPGEVADYVLLCGDPGRAERAAAKLERVRVDNRYREFVTITGPYRGIEVTVCATGIGCDNTEIAMVELSQCMPGLRPTFVRIGTSGSLQSTIEIGDMVITQGAVRMERTSTWYVPEGYPAVAHHEVVQALIASAASMGLRYHVGITATCSSFYGAQGRTVGGWRPRQPELVNELMDLGVANMEMEASTVLTLASIQGYRAGAVCVTFAKRRENVFIPMEDKHAAEDRLIDLGLASLLRLSGSLP